MTDTTYTHTIHKRKQIIEKAEVDATSGHFGHRSQALPSSISGSDLIPDTSALCAKPRSAPVAPDIRALVCETTDRSASSGARSRAGTPWRGHYGN